MLLLLSFKTTTYLLKDIQLQTKIGRAGKNKPRNARELCVRKSSRSLFHGIITRWLGITLDIYQQNN